MTRKDFIVIAEAMVAQIKAGHIKKKAIDSAIKTMGDHLLETNYDFSYQTFGDYIKARL